MPFPLAGDVGMHHHRQPLLRRQRIDLHQGRMIGARRLAFGQARQVVMAREDLPDALPEAGIDRHQLANLVGSVQIGGVEAGDERRETRLYRLGRASQRLGQDVIGTGIPVDRRIIAHVVTWLLGCVLLPFLGNADARDQGVIDLRLVHGIQQGPQTITLLEEVHEVQMGVAVVIITRFVGCHGLEASQAAGKPQQQRQRPLDERTLAGAGRKRGTDDARGKLQHGELREKVARFCGASLPRASSLSPPVPPRSWRFANSPAAQQPAGGAR